MATKKRGRTIGKFDVSKELTGNTKVPRTEKQYNGVLKKFYTFLDLSEDEKAMYPEESDLISDCFTDEIMSAFLLSEGMLYYVVVVFHKEH